MHHSLLINLFESKYTFISGVLQTAMNASMVSTPQRWGSCRTQETIAASSEGPSHPATSPHRILQSSPVIGSVNDIELSSPLNYGTPSSLGSIRTPRSGIKGTPMRQRPDIRTDKRMRQVNVSQPVSISCIKTRIYQTTLLLANHKNNSFKLFYFNFKLIKDFGET